MRKVCQNVQFCKEGSEPLGFTFREYFVSTFPTLKLPNSNDYEYPEPSVGLEVRVLGMFCSGTDRPLAGACKATDGENDFSNES